MFDCFCSTGEAAQEGGIEDDTNLLLQDATGGGGREKKFRFYSHGLLTHAQTAGEKKKTGLLQLSDNSLNRLFDPFYLL